MFTMHDLLNASESGLLLRGLRPHDLVEKYGSPLFVYDEQTLIERCKAIKSLSNLPNFQVYYSAKANSSVAVLKVIRSMKLKLDALSVGEVFLAQQAGFRNDEMLFLGNNVRKSDLERVAQQEIPICVDSLDELELALDKHNIKKIAIRLNTGLADGHHEKVKTQGAVKFGIEVGLLAKAIELAEKNGKEISGIFSHVGSFFLTPEVFQKNLVRMLEIAQDYPKISHIDFGGGFGVPYNRKEQKPFPIEDYAAEFHSTLMAWLFKNNRPVEFSIQPGRYIVAESGFCLATVQSVKNNFGRKFVGTDLGFNFLPRPTLYGSYHEILSSRPSSANEAADVVGNICEAGDILGQDRLLPKDTKAGDILVIRDTGAYCFSMSSNYNSMSRPAEVLIQANGAPQLIRKAESLDNLTRFQIYN